MRRILSGIAGIILLVVLLFSCKKETGSNASPNVASFAPDSAVGGELITINGTGLSGIRKIIFEKDSIIAPFNPSFNTENALLFRVPDTARGGLQNIILIKRNGVSAKIQFKVIALPAITDVSNINYAPGDNIVITGNNLGDVSTVIAQTTGTNINVISKSKTQLVIQMPDLASPRTKLRITNGSATLTTTQEFVNIEKAYALFSDGFQNGMENGSWGPASISADFSKRGNASFKTTYKLYNSWVNGFQNAAGVPDLASQGYTYLTFWIKGGKADQVLYLSCGGRPAGYGNNDKEIPVNVSADVWNYFKLPLSDLNLWSTNDHVFKQIGWWINGPNDGDEVIYFDDILFVK